MKIEITGWLLITVTNLGHVSTAPFPTAALCLDGQSLAVYGRTVAEKEADDQRWSGEQKAREYTWMVNHHKLGPPIDDVERGAVTKALSQNDCIGPYKSGSSKNTIECPWPRTVYGVGPQDREFIVQKNGDVLEQYHSLLSTTVDVSMFVSSPTPSEYLTAARCVPVPKEDAK